MLSGGLFLIALIAIILYDLWSDRYQRRLVRGWARQNGFLIRAFHRARLRQYPDYGSLRWRQRPAYRVCAIDAGGTFREGVVILGNQSWFGSTDDTEIRWDLDAAGCGFPVIPREPSRPANAPTASPDRTQNNGPL